MEPDPIPLSALQQHWAYYPRQCRLIQLERFSATSCTRSVGQYGQSKGSATPLHPASNNLTRSPNPAASTAWQRA